GRQFITPPKIERPYDFIGWYGCTTSVKTRDGAQVKLLGDLRQQGGLGTGLIPLDNIVGRPTMGRGISDLVDTISLVREGGGHIPDEDIPGIIARYGSKAATRAFGGDMQGQGAVFETPPEVIKHTLDPANVPTYWPWLWALDFRHSGQESGGHPFAAVLLTW